ncbi:GntR family transcriptional regulator [Phytohabitans flavus]|uniref:GntR family transcriptional regulator n=2 Tax=Phytohabitans flavus TaxID=1076124 RepID=UPI0031EC3E38
MSTPRKPAKTTSRTPAKTTSRTPAKANGAAQWSVGPVGRVAAPLREQAVSVLRQAILDFEIRPGQRLIERKLVEELDVSRATVREVLARLASEGLVTVIPQRGAIVSVLSVAEAVDIYEMRVALEVLAVQRFVERATPQRVRELRKALTGYEKAVRSRGDTNKRLRAKDAFYEALLAGAASPPLTEMLTILQSRIRLLRSTSLSVPGRALDSVHELTAIVDAIEAGDVERAGQACAAHVRAAAKTGVGRLSEMSEPVH